MYDHTKGECVKCTVPYSCCHEANCNFVIEYATKEYGVTLVPTKHPTLPLMGSNGCIAEPHLRPLCTVHVCSISGIGNKHNDDEWVKKYAQLRAKLERIEYRRHFATKQSVDRQ